MGVVSKFVTTIDSRDDHQDVSGVQRRVFICLFIVI